MKRIITILALLSLLPATALADRVLRASQMSTNQWFQRVRSGDMPEEKFRASVAAQFGVPVSDVAVIVVTMTKAQRIQAMTEMAAGTHEGFPVIPAPASTIPPTPTENLRTAIRGATSLVDLKRVLAGDEPGVPGVNAKGRP